MTKKTNKIIPAVLLSGAMLMPLSKSINPIIANACESSVYNINNSETKLSELKYEIKSKNDFASGEVFTLNDNICIPSNSSITFNLEGKYKEFDTHVNTYRNTLCELKFDFYLDEQYAGTKTIDPTVSLEAQRVHIDLNGAQKLRIDISSVTDAYKDYSFFGQLDNPVLK